MLASSKALRSVDGLGSHIKVPSVRPVSTVVKQCPRSGSMEVCHGRTLALRSVAPLLIHTCCPSQAQASPLGSSGGIHYALLPLQQQHSMHR
jgi:hypothetical protein